MQPFKNLRLLLFISLAINIMVLAFQLFHFLFNPRRGEGPARFIISTLKLDENQRKLFDQLKFEHRHQVDSLEKSIRKIRVELYTGFPSTKNYDSLSPYLAQNFQKMELVTFQHFEKIRKICTPEQQKKMDKIIPEILSQFRENRPPHKKP